MLELVLQMMMMMLVLVRFLDPESESEFELKALLLRYVSELTFNSLLFIEEQTSEDLKVLDLLKTQLPVPDTYEDNDARIKVPSAI